MRSIMPIQIRKAKLEDLDILIRIERAIFSDSWKLEHFYFELVANPIAKLMVCENDTDIVGYVDYWFSGESVEIATIGVHLKYQNQGIGSFMLEHVENEARASYIQNLTLEVRVSNKPAIHLYEKFGFKLVTIKKGYYQNNHEDALYMIKELDYE